MLSQHLHYCFFVSFADFFFVNYLAQHRVLFKIQIGIFALILTSYDPFSYCFANSSFSYSSANLAMVLLFFGFCYGLNLALSVLLFIAFQLQNVANF